MLASKFDARHFGDPRLDRSYQRKDIRRRAIRIYHNEIRVFLTHPSVPNPHSATASDVNEASGVVAGRILKDATRVRPTGLMFTTPSHDLLDARLSYLGFAPG